MGFMKTNEGRGARERKALLWIYAPLLLSDKAETSRNNFVNPSSLRPSSVRVRVRLLFHFT